MDNFTLEHEKRIENKELCLFHSDHKQWLKVIQNHLTFHVQMSVKTQSIKKVQMSL